MWLGSETNQSIVDLPTNHTWISIHTKNRLLPRQIKLVSIFGHLRQFSTIFHCGLSCRPLVVPRRLFFLGAINHPPTKAGFPAVLHRNWDESQETCAVLKPGDLCAHGPTVPGGFGVAEHKSCWWSLPVVVYTPTTARSCCGFLRRWSVSLAAVFFFCKKDHTAASTLW